MTKYKIMTVSGLALCLVTMLSACGGSDPQPVQQPVQYAPQPPVIVNQPAPAPVQQQAAPVVVQQDDGIGVGTALAAGAVGYLAGSSNNRQPSYQQGYDNRGYAPAPRVVHRTTVIKQKVYVQQPKPQKQAYTRTVTKTTFTKKARR
jgi:hypothetical protein